MNYYEKNCKDEFLDHTEGKEVLCALVNNVGLPIGYSEKQYSDFLNKIDFLYDSGYGSPEIDGFIWYNDGTWSERGEYDGSEWWEYKNTPEIPKNLKKEGV